MSALPSLELLQVDIAELVDRPFFAVVLDADVATGVGVVLKVGDGDAVELNVDAIVSAGDLIAVPVVAFEGTGDLGLLHVFLGFFGVS